MATAYRTLRGLGDEKFQTIVNRLMRGTPATALAREIQLQPPDGWGDLQDQTESSIGLQLNRLRQEIAEGAFGKEAAEEIAKGKKPQVQALAKISVSTLQRMEELADIQRERVLALVAREKVNLLPQLKAGGMAPQEYRHILTQTNQVFTDYQSNLLNLQKLRFDLGLDDFKGPVTAIRGASVTTTTPEGATVQKQVFEAVNAVEKIFESHRKK